MLALKAPGQGSFLRAWGNNAYRNSNHLPKKFFWKKVWRNPVKFLRDSHSLPVGRVDRAQAVSENFFKIFLKKFFSGFYYRVAGGGYFTTFLKQNFENLICDGKLNWGGEEKKNFLCQIFIHLFLSDVKSAVRPAIVLFENYSYLLGGRRQKCLWTKIFSLVLLIQKRLWTKTFHTSAHRRFRQVRSDRISFKYTFLSESTNVFVIVHSCIKKEESVCSPQFVQIYVFVREHQHFLSDSILKKRGQTSLISSCSSAAALW